MKVTEWIDKLEKTFSENGVIGNSLLEVIKSEEGYRPFITNTFKGYLVLTDSFLSFSILLNLLKASFVNGL